MIAQVELSPDESSLVLSVPLTLRRRGGRKEVVSPDGVAASAALMPRSTRPDSSVVKALARAFRWRKLLEESAFSTIQELAAAEKVNVSYVSRVLRLTLLAPDIVEAMLDGKDGVPLWSVFRPLPENWSEQRQALSPRSEKRLLRTLS